ncbi:MAG: DUF2145 domain-containing protein [Gammaproteobacteria bacterium]
MLRALVRTWLLAWLLAAAPLAGAGTACEQHEPDATAFVKAITLAEKSAAALDASNAQVALIARVGQDLSKYGLRYSHIAYVWRDHPKGRWTVVHELNECGTAHSSLYDQGLVNFFSDDLFAWESVILVPSPDSQARIVRMLQGDAPRLLHEARYNMLSYAFGTTYQNSNQWVLETYAAAASALPVQGRAQAQAWLKLAGYAPITISIPAAIRLGARMFKANVAFDDHPFARRMTRQIDTVTVESMLKFVRRVDPGAREMQVSAN